MRNVNVNSNDNIKYNKNENINLIVDLSKLFDDIDLKQTNSIMIPGQKAMKIADLSTKIFSLE
jgi:outer membrane usher protein FimD/PapC